MEGKIKGMEREIIYLAIFGGKEKKGGRDRKRERGEKTEKWRRETV